MTSLTKYGVADLAARDITANDRRIAMVSAQYLDWIEAQDDQAIATQALQIARGASNRVTAVLVTAGEVYAELLGDPPAPGGELDLQQVEAKFTADAGNSQTPIGLALSEAFVPRSEQTAIDDLPSADPLDGSEFVPVWQGGENKKVTTDDLAGLDRVVRIPAAIMFSANGSPSLSVVNRHQAYMLDANSNEAIGFNAAGALPEHWSTFHVDVVWINAGAGAGDVTFRADYSIEGDGAAIANPATGSVIIGTHAAGAQNVRVRSTITNTVSAPTTGTDSMPMALFRMATNGTDTLPNDCGILEVLLVRET